MNKRQLANAYAAGKPGACHNAKSTGNTYLLHYNAIVERQSERVWRFNWCGWHTHTTASHMNEVLRALGVPMRVSYAKARDNGETNFTITT